MKYDFLNLDSFEFEKFCSDFLRKKLNMEFKTFSIGKDGGVDAYGYEDIICQCKRYSNYRNLKAVCNKEKEKLKSLNCKEYYLITTVDLSVDNTNELYDIFKDYMPDIFHIIGLQDIEDFIDRKENIDILEKNHKLWLSSANVLDLFFHKYSSILSQDKLKDIEKETKYFVETKAYREAIEIVKKRI